MGQRRSRFLAWVRTAHIYATMLGLPLLLFSAVTGFMLNHGPWSGMADPQVRVEQGVLEKDLLLPTDKLQIAEALRARFGAAGHVDSFAADEQELRVVFKRPGYRAEAVVQRADGATELTIESTGAAGTLTDLHKAAQAGPWWPLCLDAAAVLLAIASVTGAVLCFSLPRRRIPGAIALALCLAACLFVYWRSVP